MSEQQKNTEVTVKINNASTYYISTEKYSYGIFCFNDAGDLFLNSDYGMYGFAWRAFGDDFKAFLSSTNADYIFGKFETNNHYLNHKNLPKHVRVPVTGLIEEFINALKSEFKP